MKLPELTVRRIEKQAMLLRDAQRRVTEIEAAISVMFKKHRLSATEHGIVFDEGKNYGTVLVMKTGQEYEP